VRTKLAPSEKGVVYNIRIPELIHFRIWEEQLCIPSASLFIINVHYFFNPFRVMDYGAHLLNCLFPEEKESIPLIQISLMTLNVI
jgi:hypothetical protein